MIKSVFLSMQDNY